MVGADEIACFAPRQMEGDRVAKSIDERMDLGAQPAAGAANGLILPGFFLAPALC